MTHHQAIELLTACPFCPSSTIFIEPDEIGSGGQWVAPIHVGCATCKAEQRGDTREEAIAAWNRRAAPASEPADRDSFTADDIETAWCAGYYEAGYTNDSAYASMKAKEFAAQLPGWKIESATPAAPEVPAPAALPAMNPACGCRACNPQMAGRMMFLCATCGNKRCPHANHHANECTGSNEPGQKGSAYP